MRPRPFILIVAVGGIAAIALFLLLRATEVDPEKTLASAEAYFAEGEFDRARIEYRKVLSVQPENAHATGQIGLTFSEQGIPLQAIPFLAKALELAPDNVEPKAALARSLMSVGDLAGARKLAAEYLDHDPADGEMMILLANASATDEQIEDGFNRLETLDAEADPAYLVARAILASRKGEDAKEIRPMLDRALAMSPDSLSVNVARANFFGGIGDVEEERRALAAAADGASVRSGASLRYARFLARHGEGERARALIEECVESAPDFVPALIMQAEAKAAEGDRQGALQVLERVFGRDPMNFGARMARAQILLDQGESAAAGELLAKLDEAYSGRAPMLAFPIKMSLARLHAGSGDVTRARAVLDEAMAINPLSADAIMLLAEIDIRSGGAMAASRALERLLAARPGLRRAEILLGQAYTALEEHDKAVEVFRRRADSAPDEAGPQFDLGIALRNAGELDAALQSFEKALKLIPDDLRILYQVVELNIEKGDLQRALGRAREYAAKFPEDWAPLFLEGRILIAQEQWQQAERVLTRALELKPDSVNIYNALVGLYLRQDQLPQAISRLRTLLEASPGLAPQRMLLAMLLENNGEAEAAVGEYEALIASHPETLLALNNLAFLYAESSGKLDRALDLAMQARKLAPGSAAIADTLGWVHFLRNEIDEALPLLREAAASVSENPEIQYHLAMAYSMAGEVELAASAFRKAVAAGDSFAQFAESKRRLALLDPEEAGGAAETIERLQALLRETPGDLSARVRLGQVREQAGAHDEAAAAYAEALKSNPDLVPALSALARLYLGPLDDVQKAAALAERARAREPDNPRVVRLLGEVALEQGDFNYASSLLKDALDSEAGSDPALVVAYGHAVYGAGRTADARAAMSTLADGAADSPHTAEARLFLMLTAAAGGEDVARLARETLEQNPRSLPALMASAATNGGAIRIYQGILEIAPEFVPAQLELARHLVRRGEQLDTAEQLVRKARDGSEDEPTLKYIRGILSHHRGDHADAIRLLRESSAAGTLLDGVGSVYLGLSLIEIGRDSEGKELLRSALRTELPKPLRERAESALP